MYYSPHNNPGGICLAYANDLEGPWHEFADNPLISNSWEPHYHVSHVCSPHAIWIKDRLFIYFHGENSCTRFATSFNGINFNYGDIAVTEKHFNCSNSSFYARVFPYKYPGHENYMMLLMCHLQDTSAIFMATSSDGRKWKARRKPLIIPAKETGLKYLCSPWLYRKGKKYYVIYHGDKGNMLDMITDIYASELGLGFKHSKFSAKICAHDDISADNRRVSDPCIIEEEGKVYLFMSTGTRLNQKLGLAIAHSQ